MRICSLLPSATEILGELGLAESLVAVSEECDWPPEVTDLPVVTASRVDSAVLRSAEIDAAVRDAVRGGESLYALDADLIAELRPDVIVTQDLCAVCAVSSDDVGRLCAVDAEVISLDPRTIAGICSTVTTLAKRFGVDDRATEVVDTVRRTIAEVAAAVDGLPVRRVFVAEWLDPPFAAGHWLPEMVRLAGGVDVLGREGEPSYATTWEDVRARDPELVVLAPCGFDAERASREAAGIAIPAPAVAVDANAYYSRPSPRVAEGVRQLASLFHSGAVQSMLPAIPVR